MLGEITMSDDLKDIIIEELNNLNPEAILDNQEVPVDEEYTNEEPETNDELLDETDEVETDSESTDEEGDSDE